MSTLTETITRELVDSIGNPGGLDGVLKRHSRTKANSPQTNGICERFHRPMQDECYSLLFRKKLYR